MWSGRGGGGGDAGCTTGERVLGILGHVTAAGLETPAIEFECSRMTEDEEAELQLIIHGTASCLGTLTTYFLSTGCHSSGLDIL
jgi:hypothetical protein